MKEGNKVSVAVDYLARLEKKVETLKILTEVSPVISSTLDLKELMTIVMEKAKDIMQAEACSILLYNKDTKKLEFEVAISENKSATDILKEKISLDLGQGIAGWVAQNRELLFIKDVRKDKRFYHEADKKTGFTTKSLIAAPLIGRRGLIGVAEIINPGKEEYDLEILKILTKHFAIAIENALYHKDALEKERLKQELEIAATLQKSFLPESPRCKKGNVMVSAVNIPAKLVGGDLYDFTELSGGKLGIFIGDVCGKGISAALYMAKIISDFRYIAHAEDSPEIVMNRLNSLLSKTPRGMFLTAIYMIMDTRNGGAVISVAGHPPFLWITQKGVKVSSLVSGAPLGIIPEDYSSGAISLSKGDRLLLITDGVFEAKNKKGQRIGFSGLLRFVKKNKNDKRLVKKIAEYVNIFSRGAEKADDLTIVEVKYL
ncbi:MAG: GAF domain-containing protein [Nitrospira sp.]|nr:GAF domain-containing protein [Nitrospira sp.]